jgi:bacterial/archaeal transporter family-2 protein
MGRDPNPEPRLAARQEKAARRSIPAQMDRYVAVLATVAVGALIAFQPPINSELGKRTTVLAAALISTAISALVMLALAAVLGDLGQVRRVPHIPVIYLTGGLLGAALVSVSLVTVRVLGAGGVVAATVTGQLIVSAILDRFGVLGLDKIGLSPLRIGGFAFLLIGTAMVTAR